MGTVRSTARTTSRICATRAYVLRPGAVITHAQITDVFLLGLAVHKGGRLATFDERIPTATVQGGAKALVLVPA